MPNLRNATAWLWKGQLIPMGQEPDELKEHLRAAGLLPDKEDDMATKQYRHAGKVYTAETLHEAPEEFIHELRRRGVRTPETEALPKAVLADVEGIGAEMEAALRKAGYKSVKALAGAQAADLVANVAGVGAKTAPKLIAAAQALHSFEAGEPAGASASADASVSVGAEPASSIGPAPGDAS